MPLSGCGVSLLRVEIENETFQGNFWESRMRVIVLGENQSLRMGMRVLTCQMLRNMQTFLVSRWYSSTSCWGRVYGEGKPHPGKVYHLVEVYLPLWHFNSSANSTNSFISGDWFSNTLNWKFDYFFVLVEVLKRASLGSLPQRRQLRPCVLMVRIPMGTTEKRILLCWRQFT